MQLAELPSGRIEFDVYGPDDSPHPPVLLIHGALVNGLLWRDVAQRLAEGGYRCYVPALPLGAHRLPVEIGTDLSPTALASMIGEFVHAFDLDNATVLANDTGGGLCQIALAADPDLFGRLVLTNCDAFDTFPPQPFKTLFKLIKHRAILRATMTTFGSPAIRHSWIGFGLLATNLDPQLTDEMTRTLRTDRAIQRDAAAIAAGIDKLGDITDASNKMQSVKIPVTVLWGMDDRHFHAELGRRLAATFPNGRFTEAPNSRTFVPLDNPQAVVDAVLEIGARESV